MRRFTVTEVVLQVLIGGSFYIVKAIFSLLCCCIKVNKLWFGMVWFGLVWVFSAFDSFGRNKDRGPKFNYILLCLSSIIFNLLGLILTAMGTFAVTDDWGPSEVLAVYCPSSISPVVFIWLSLWRLWSVPFYYLLIYCVLSCSIPMYSVLFPKFHGYV